VRKPPAGLFVAVAVLLLTLGTAWWTSAEPPSAGAEPTPATHSTAPRRGAVLVPSIGGLTSVEKRPIHRRCRPAYQSLRSVGQDGRRRC
jgi:hypothetical protein